MNQYPLWKNLLIVIVLLVGGFYAAPNFFGVDDALQISANRGAPIGAELSSKTQAALKEAGLPPKLEEFTQDGLLLRFNSPEAQRRAYDVVQNALGENYTVALNLAPAAPAWMQELNARPMYLGLDLRGGVHFLLEVDIKSATDQALERFVGDVRSLLQEEKVRYLTVTSDGNRVVVKFRDDEALDKGSDLVRRKLRELELRTDVQDGTPVVYANISEVELRNIRKLAVQQNVTTLRNRVNTLGVTEPVIQQQGEDRIVVQLAGVQDTAIAKEILGATATLEYHLVDEEADPAAAAAGRVPPGSRVYRQREGGTVVLKRDIIAKGDQITRADFNFDQQTGEPMVEVWLDATGARRMGETTRENIGRRMAVVLIETRSDLRTVNGKQERVTRKIEEVISVAVIRGHFSNRFQTTGLDDAEEARTLAMLLRAGALAAPMQIVEERTIGPSLGADNVRQGSYASLAGFVMVILFMGLWYRKFGLVANVALLTNVTLIVAVLSMLQATLTLPGIAGIALTIGMAVDANVLIFERIREELRNGNSPQASIAAGYSRAFGTILDSNITTLIAAFVLYLAGTGPVKGFAVTLSIGILTSMFTALLVSRAIVNAVWGGRRVPKLSI